MTVNGLDDECWEYLDPKAVKRGPFSGKRMAQWYEHQMLPEDLGIRHSSAMPFVPIKELFHPPLIPFKTRPRPSAPPPIVAKCCCHWQYRDTKGIEQGPFSSPQMALWFEHNMLPKSLPLRRSTDHAFFSIDVFFPSPLTPFVSQPVDPAASRAAPKPAPQVPPAPQGPQALHAQQAAVNGSKAASKAPPAKAKSKAEGKRGGRPAEEAKAGYPTDAAAEGGGAGGGRNGGAAATSGNAKGRNRQAAKEAAEEWWSEQNWAAAGDKAWWDSQWNSWTGWSADGWEQSGRDGGAKGAEWKGAGGDAVGAAGASPQKEKGAVQAAFGSLKWGPPAEEPDLFPEGVIRKVLDEGIVWEERWVSPLEVRFSQGKIHPFFHERGPISEVLLQIRYRDDDEGADAGGSLKRIEPPFPPIRLLHLKQQGVLVTLDNRRLYALQRYALQEWPSMCWARALCVDELTPTRLRAENRKFTNRLCGLQLEVESRSNAFETFSWVTEAAHMEATKFCRPASFRAVDKALSLFPILVVHALMSPQLRRVVSSRWPMLELFSRYLPNPQRRSFPTKRIMMNHVFELARPSRQVRQCPDVCVAYKAETVVMLSKGKSSVTSKLAVQRPLELMKGTPAPMTHVQSRVLAALLPLLCLPYARSTLRGHTRRWVETFLLAWGKVAVARLELPLYQ